MAHPGPAAGLRPAGGISPVRPVRRTWDRALTARRVRPVAGRDAGRSGRRGGCLWHHALRPARLLPLVPARHRLRSTPPRPRHASHPVRWLGARLGHDERPGHAGAAQPDRARLGHVRGVCDTRLAGLAGRCRRAPRRRVVPHVDHARRGPRDAGGDERHRRVRGPAGGRLPGAGPPPPRRAGHPPRHVRGAGRSASQRSAGCRSTARRPACSSSARTRSWT